MIGKTISHYKILEKIGEGGMGVVYKAEDTKLQRNVALKFLPSELTRDNELKERFVREAQAAAALDHPHICTVHEINEAEGQTFIAMAYIKGKSLKEKIAKGPLEIEEAVNIATQVAEGLKEAHERGIVHRDIKPANIMLTEKGQAKIMDFGLAKLEWGADLTKTATIMGTVAYMSPEQASGKTVDHRTDIWSLGCMLYEMLTGERPFRSRHDQAVIYSILNDEPEPLTKLRPSLPLGLEWIVNKALAKSPDERYQHVDEIPVDLKAMKAEPIPLSIESAVATERIDAALPKKWKRTVPWMLCAFLAIIAGLASWGPWRKSLGKLPSPTRFTINLPLTAPLWLTQVFQQPSAALSPDGSKLVYVATKEGVKQLCLREMNQFDANPLPGTDDARSPFFSPDGEWVAFLTGSTMKKMSLSSGAVVTICDVFPDVSTAGCWGPDDNIYFAPGPSRGLAKVSASGGTPEQITNPDLRWEEAGHWYPEVLPGGAALLFVIRKGGWSDTRIAVLSLKTGEWHTLVEGGTQPHYLSTGHLVYAQSGTLLAAPFDLEQLKITSPPVRVLEGVITRSGAEFSLSKDGSLAFIPGTSGWPKSTLYWVDRQGKAQSLPLEPLTYSVPRLSPDGRLFAIEIISQQKGNRDIWVCDLDRYSRTRLTYNPITDTHSVWSPDGKYLAFAAGSKTLDAPELVWKPADGSGEAVRLCEMEYANFPSSFSPDGRNMLFTDEHPETKLDIWTLMMDGDEPEPRPVVKTPFNETAAVFSPDGRWIAYQADESGRFEVYVRPFSGSGAKHQISTDGGTEPVWSPDGRELFFRNGDKMMVVNINPDPEFNVSKPNLLFRGWYSTDRIAANYDISPDGQRFLMIKGEQTAATQIKVVLNWAEELKRLVNREN